MKTTYHHSVTASGLLEFIRDNQLSEAKATESRMAWFQKNILPMTPQEVADLFKQAASKAREDAGLSKGDKKKATEEVRLSEAKRIYGAAKYAGLDLKSGWHQCAEAARAVLKEKSLKWDGQHAETPDERKRNAQASAYGKAMFAIKADYPDLSLEKQEEKAQALLEQWDHDARMSKVSGIVQDIMEDPDHARELYQALASAIKEHDRKLKQEANMAADSEKKQHAHAA